MKRWIVFLALTALAGGCASINPFVKKPKGEPEVLAAEDWKSLQLENAKRIEGQGIPRAAATSQPTGNFEEFKGFMSLIFWELPKRTIEFWTGNTPGKYARLMEDDQSADARRTGILKLSNDYEFARKDPYTKRYWQIAQGDPDYLVRVAAIRALNRSRDKTVIPAAIKALDDPNPHIRLEAAKALANIPDASAAPALLKHLGTEIEVRGESGRMERQTETSEVRVACADALRNFKTKEVARALADRLLDKQFEVAWQARQSLILMTGHDYKYDPARWQAYFSAETNPFG